MEGSSSRRAGIIAPFVDPASSFGEKYQEAVVEAKRQAEIAVEAVNAARVGVEDLQGKATRLFHVLDAQKHTRFEVLEIVEETISDGKLRLVTQGPDYSTLLERVEECEQAVKTLKTLMGQAEELKRLRLMLERSQLHRQKLFKVLIDREKPLDREALLQLVEGWGVAIDDFTPPLNRSDEPSPNIPLR